MLRTCSAGLLFVTLVLAALPAVLMAQNWELIWEDEFEGGQLDPERWSFELGDGCPNLCGWGNGELQYYRIANATVAEGLLTLTARAESFLGYDYTSARIRTKDKGDWLYGRFEMRARMPRGRGLWAAFWMLPTDQVYGRWAASGEIDIMEHVGHEPASIHGTIHYGGEAPSNRQAGRTYRLPEGAFADAFHLFAVEWEPEEIRWYVDGTLYATQNRWSSEAADFPAPFDRRFHLLFNLAVGGSWPGPPDETTQFPQSMQIDYVRVYQDPAYAQLQGAPVDLAGGDMGPRVPSAATTGDSTAVVFENFERGAADWTFFTGANAVGSGQVLGDRPPEGAGYLSTDWSGQGSENVFYGGLFRNLANADQIRLPLDPWINLYVYNERVATADRYALEITLREDLDGNGWTDGREDSFRLDIVLESSVEADTWTLISAPLGDFTDMESGGDGRFDGALDEVVLVISQVSGGNPATVALDLDFLVFSSGGPIVFPSTAVEAELAGPTAFRLDPARPNPFNPSTTLSYQLGQAVDVRLEIFNALGEKVQTLVQKRQEAGFYQVRFDAGQWASGLYFYRLRAGGQVQVRKMVLLR
ncbi:MAG: family 16 glycosylhydrolase [Candidatus Latescibacteria bacterium]|nr:family 16 glycosylhydrolase [Candidatus Latescibacterota bacterium]